MASILIFDERPQRRRRLAMTLAHGGHAVIEADSAARALELMRRDPADLLLLDVLAPPAGGGDLVRRLRLESSAPPRVAFFFDPCLESEAGLLARDCGVVHAVPDNAGGATLLAVVRTALAETPPAARAGGGLAPVVSRLYGRVTELESSSTRLKRGMASSAAQLAMTRGALIREVTKRLWSEEDMTTENNRLLQQAVRDPLTGLYNRRYLDESLAREESRARRSGRPFCVMMLDVDHVQRYSDTFGHGAGEHVLLSVSQCVASMARPEDILCRCGGEEFALVLTGIEPGALNQRAEGLRAGIRKLRIVHDEWAIGQISLSIGLAVFPNDGDSAGEVLHQAGAALYQARCAGRDRVVAACRAGAHQRPAGDDDGAELTGGR